MANMVNVLGEIESEYTTARLDLLVAQIKELFLKSLIDKPDIDIDDEPMINYCGCILEYVPILSRERLDSGVLVHFEDGTIQDLNDMDKHGLEYILGKIKHSPYWQNKNRGYKH